MWKCENYGSKELGYPWLHFDGFICFTQKNVMGCLLIHCF